MTPINSVEQFQQVAQLMLEKHYGLSLNDTQLTQESYVRALVQSKVAVHEYLNEHALDCDLDRVDDVGAWGIPSKAALTKADEVCAMALLAVPVGRGLVKKAAPRG